MSKAVDRFEVVCVRIAKPNDTDDTLPFHYEMYVKGTLVRIMTLHYETHADARLGANGMRMIGYEVVGIRDLHSDELVDASEIKRPEEAGWHP